MPHLDHITAEARIIGSAKTTWFTEDGGIVGINTDVTGIKNSLLTVITGISSPFPSEMPLSFEPGKSAGFLLGGGGAARAAVRAMIQLNLCPVLSSIEISLTAALIEIYPHANLRSLSDLFIAEAELGNLTVVGVPIVQEFVPFQQSHQRRQPKEMYTASPRWPLARSTPDLTNRGDHNFLTWPDAPILSEMPYNLV
ncbi:MAG: hypothetical protein CYPHOPRED_004806 [Cyphobasidiales sp. Tagirdzhanova-0007]|nr:MAG: hypothetical protein CYPHOPRED_004806 [Cyphobasidiales sp. Tagirdzhanova-0007]